MNAEWIDVSSKKPTPLLLVLGFRAAKPPCICYVNRDGDWFSDEHCNVYNITHWMPLPEPPKRESSFEKWWPIARSDYDVVGCMMREPRQTAHRIWDAAIAASKRPDFVE